MKRKGIMTKDAGCTGPYSHAELVSEHESMKKLRMEEQR